MTKVFQPRGHVRNPKQGKTPHKSEEACPNCGHKKIWNTKKCCKCGTKRTGYTRVNWKQQTYAQ
jgi:hypothetical protein